MNNIALAFVTGLTTGGLSCLAVQGGLLASSIAHEVEQSVAQAAPQHRQDQPARLKGRSQKQGKARARVQAQHPPLRAARPIVLFLAAKLVAYTILGFLLGLLGSVLQLTPTMRAVLLTGIGIFMVGTALRMLNVHPIFRYFALEPPPAVTRYIRRKSKEPSGALTPLFLGALTVLIPCGVTQAMMAVAMGTGNPVTGATIMFAFVLGTSPVFFAVAYLATRLGARLEKSFTTIVAVVVLVLGLVSIDSGLTLAGWPYSVTNLRTAMTGARAGVDVAQAQVSAQDSGAAQKPSAQKTPEVYRNLGGLESLGPMLSNNGVVTITVANNGYHPTVARARPDQPFRVALVTKNTYSCARAFVMPSLGVEKVLPATGTVVIDVPAQPVGSKLFYSCSMGMYSGVIVFDG